MREDALVEPLEARGQQRQPLSGGELLDDLLGQLPSLRGQRNDAVVGDAAVRSVESSGHDIDAQHHSRAATVGIVVHLGVRERRVVAVAEQAQVELVAEHGRDGPLLGQPRERVRDQGEDVELQRRPPPRVARR